MKTFCLYAFSGEPCRVVLVLCHQHASGPQHCLQSLAPQGEVRRAPRTPLQIPTRAQASLGPGMSVAAACCSDAHLHREFRVVVDQQERSLVLAWAVQIRAFEKEVDARRAQMTNYMFFLRVTPFLPNTFINVASPVVHVPYRAFAVGSVFGCLPNNFMAVKVSRKLSYLEQASCIGT